VIANSDIWWEVRMGNWQILHCRWGSKITIRCFHTASVGSD
jgi:hypothetical protein